MSDSPFARHLEKVFVYNEWAWQRVFPSLAALPPEEYFRERPFFWGSLHGLTVHSYGAEWIWFQRVQGTSPTALPQADAFPDLAAVRARWDPLRAEWRSFAQGLTDADLAQVVTSQNTQGAPRRLVLADLLQHVMNHATEHRSQMTPILFQLGHATEPLDYSQFVAS